MDAHHHGMHTHLSRSPIARLPILPKSVMAIILHYFQNAVQPYVSFASLTVLTPFFFFFKKNYIFILFVTLTTYYIYKHIIIFVFFYSSSNAFNWELYSSITLTVVSVLYTEYQPLFSCGGSATQTIPYWFG